MDTQAGRREGGTRTNVTRTKRVLSSRQQKQDTNYTINLKTFSLLLNCWPDNNYNCFDSNTSKLNVTNCLQADWRIVGGQSGVVVVRALFDICPCLHFGFESFKLNCTNLGNPCQPVNELPDVQELLFRAFLGSFEYPSMQGGGLQFAPYF